MKNIPAILSAIEIAESDPKILTAGKLARDASGKPVSTLDPAACRWCLLGLVAREANVNLTFVSDALRLIESSDNEIWGHNDDGLDEGDPLRGVRYLKGLLNAEN